MIAPEISKSSSQHFYRLFKIILALLFLAATFLWWVTHSEWLPSYAIKQMLSQSSARLKMRIELEGFAGSLINGFIFDRLSIHRPIPPFRVEIRKADINIDLSRLFKGKAGIAAQLDSVTINGMGQFPIKSSDIPDLPDFGCFVALPTNLTITEIIVNKTKIIPWNNLPFTVELGKTSLTLQKEEKNHNLFSQFTATFRNRQIGRGKLTGELIQRQQHFNGDIDLELLGQKVVSEIAFAKKRKGTEISGYISTSTIDIAVISSWLLPTWQENFPFGFDGKIDCTGSWLFNPKTGFLGNLSGRLQNLRMIAQGLFITIFELNSDWNISGDSLKLNDTGSSFLGFLGSINGEVERLFLPNRKWNIDFNCNTIDFSRLFSDLPWIIKYGMAIPELSGSARLFAELRNYRQEAFARIGIDRLDIYDNSKKRTISGQIDYQLGKSGKGCFSAQISCIGQNSLPPFLDRFTGSKGVLTEYISALHDYTESFIFAYHFKGDDIDAINLTGSFKLGKSKLFDIKGKWRNGIGIAHMALFDSDRKAYIFSADNLKLLDLLLAR